MNVCTNHSLLLGICIAFLPFSSAVAGPVNPTVSPTTGYYVINKQSINFPQSTKIIPSISGPTVLKLPNGAVNTAISAGIEIVGVKEPVPIRVTFQNSFSSLRSFFTGAFSFGGIANSALGIMGATVGGVPDLEQRYGLKVGVTSKDDAGGNPFDYYYYTYDSTNFNLVPDGHKPLKYSESQDLTGYVSDLVSTKTTTESLKCSAPPVGHVFVDCISSPVAAVKTTQSCPLHVSKIYHHTDLVFIGARPPNYHARCMYGKRTEVNFNPVYAEAGYSQTEIAAERVLYSSAGDEILDFYSVPDKLRYVWPHLSPDDIQVEIDPVEEPPIITPDGDLTHEYKVKHNFYVDYYGSTPTINHVRTRTNNTYQDGVLISNRVEADKQTGTGWSPDYEYEPTNPDSPDYDPYYQPFYPVNPDNHDEFVDYPDDPEHPVYGGQNGGWYPDPDTNPNPNGSLSDCSFFPTLCAWLNWTQQEPEQPQDQSDSIFSEVSIQQQEFLITASGSGCPAPIELNLDIFGNHQVKYDSFCELATRVKPLYLTFMAFFASLILYRGIV